MKLAEIKDVTVRAKWNAMTPEQRVTFLRNSDPTMKSPTYKNLITRMSNSAFSELTSVQQSMLNDHLTEGKYDDPKQDAEISRDAEAAYKKAHAIMRAKGFTHKAITHSAATEHRYVKGSREITLDGWHGTGKGNRNYGNTKSLFTMYDNEHPNYKKGYKPVYDVMHAFGHEGTKNGKNEETAAEHRKHIAQVLKYLEDL